MPVVVVRALMLRNNMRYLFLISLNLLCITLLSSCASAPIKPKKVTELKTVTEQKTFVKKEATLKTVSEKFDHAFSDSRVEVDLKNDHIQLIMPSYYIFNRKGPISGYSKKYLNEIAETAKNNLYKKIDVYGYTSHEGGIAKNQSLSAGWAGKVKNYLIAQGITKTKIISAGRGEFYPIANNYTFAGKLKNRRVEVLLYL